MAILLPTHRSTVKGLARSSTSLDTQILPCTKLYKRHFSSYQPPYATKRLVIIAKDSQGKTPTKDVTYKWRPPSREEASLRAEAEAPFRSIRVVLFGFGVVSAAVASLFAFPRLIGALLGAPNAMPLTDIGLDMAINIGVLLVCGYVVRNDLKARDQQISRLLRADQLGACQLELANGKLLRLAQLRGFARAVIIAGTPDQVASSIAAAEPYREDLIERGVLVVGLPIFGEYNDNIIPKLTADDLRWRAEPIRLAEWKQWFDEQASMANKATTEGLYVGLRMDGRVRASGTGCPPWGKFAAQLPPTSGFFQGFLDGMDGRV